MISSFLLILLGSMTGNDWFIYYLWGGFPGGSVVKNTPLMQETQRWGFNPWVRKISWSRKWQPTPVLLPGIFHGWRSLAAPVHGLAKNLIQLSTGVHTHTHTHTHITPRLSERQNTLFCLKHLQEAQFNLCFCAWDYITADNNPFLINGYFFWLY